MTKLKLTAIGDSTGLIFPQDLLDKLHVERGDTLTVTELPDGIILRPHDSEYKRQMEAGERIMRKDREALRMLAQGPE